jgi:Putative zinc-finger
MSCQMIMSLGVYVLGAADAGERARVEAHLPGCPACQAELMGLAPLPGLLADVPSDLRPEGKLLGEAAGQAAPARTRGRPHRRWRVAAVAPAGTGARPDRRWRVAAVVASVAAIAGAAGGFWLAPSQTGTAPRPATVTLSGANPAMHVSATAALTATSWGTSIQLNLRGLPVNVRCRLIVHSRTGATEVSGVWDAWTDGPISVPASADWRPSDIASLEVATPARTLVTISAANRGRHSPKA